MASVFAYFRPRGVPGNYKVGILLDLLPTEQAKVYLRKRDAGWRDIECTFLANKRFYTATALTQNNENIVRIEIRDKDIALPQRIGFEPTHESIQIEKIQISSETLRYNRVIFHEIILVDLDELTMAARQGKIHELDYMPEIAQVRQMLQRD